MASLLIDIGNSSVVTAHYENGRISRTKRYPTRKFTTVFDYKAVKAYDRVLVSSVVPKLDRRLKRFKNVLFVTHETIPVLKVAVDAPEQVGADRLVNALAAYLPEKRPTLIVDSGTATTFCLVDASGHYLGGAIYPGMKIASKALKDYTAKIPLVLVSPQETLIGKTTRDAVQVGLYHGSIHMINGMIDAYKAEISGLKVVGTGKGLSVLKDHLNLDQYDPQLILKGLALVTRLMGN